MYLGRLQHERDANQHASPTQTDIEASMVDITPGHVNFKAPTRHLEIATTQSAVVGVRPDGQSRVRPHEQRSAV